MCFARKVCRLASKRQKTAHGTASGSAPQALPKGPQNTIPTSSCGLSSPKNVTLPQRFAGIVRKACREEQQKPFFAPIFAPKTFCECLRFRGKGLWQICDPRQYFLATPLRHAGTVQRRSHARKLSSALLLLGVSGIQAESPFRPKWAANLCGNRGKGLWQSTRAAILACHPNRRLALLQKSVPRCQGWPRRSAFPRVGG
jgi:hypothetical protein